MTVVCNVNNCPHNRNNFCMKDIVSIVNGSCRELVKPTAVKIKEVFVEGEFVDDKSGVS